MSEKWYDDPVSVALMIVFAAACLGDDIGKPSNSQTTLDISAAEQQTDIHQTETPESVFVLTSTTAPR